MKRLFAVVLLALLCAAPQFAAAWPYPPASGVSVTTNGHANITNITVQSVIDWLDDNIILTSGGYVTAASLASALSSTSTQTFGTCNVVVAPTNAVRNLEAFYGFRATMTNGASSVVTNLTPSYGAVTNLDSATYNPQSWYSTSTFRFVPLIEGYYRLDIEALGTVTGLVRIVDQATNTMVQADGAATNQCIAGGGIVYASGVSTNYFFVVAQTNNFSRFVFSGHYLGN